MKAGRKNAHEKLRASSGESERHKWEFKARFRRNAFGCRSQPAITRIRQAVSEIKRVAKKSPMLAAEGAIAFLERVSPAIEHVDSSSGAIGTAVNKAISELVPIIAGAPADTKVRDRWLERLWKAHQDAEVPYIERLGDYWGELCASKETGGAWGDRLIDAVRMALGAGAFRVIRDVAGEIGALVVFGAVLGLFVALGTTQLISSFLFGLTPNDPWTLGTATAVLVAVAILAAAAPAWRASRIDPAIVLRHD